VTIFYSDIIRVRLQLSLMGCSFIITILVYNTTAFAFLLELEHHTVLLTVGMNLFVYNLSFDTVVMRNVVNFFWFCGSCCVRTYIQDDSCTTIFIGAVKEPVGLLSKRPNSDQSA